MIDSNEILRSAAELGLDCSRLERDPARAYIDTTLDLYRPFRTSGHLGIANNSDAYPIELAEYDYSAALQPGPVRLFFGQSSPDRNEVVELADGRRLCAVMENCFGIEYFASNPAQEYLIAVNWYVVEVAGVARLWLRGRYPGAASSR